MKKTDFMNTKIKNGSEERRKIFENIFPEVVASIFLGSLTLFCSRILFRS
jgi:hypothetical protein